MRPAGNISANDDAARASQLYCDLLADSILDGLAAGQVAAGVDLGAQEAPVEPTLARELSPEPDTTAAEAPAAEAGEEAASEEQAG